MGWRVPLVAVGRGAIELPLDAFLSVSEPDPSVEGFAFLMGRGGEFDGDRLFCAGAGREVWSLSGLDDGAFESTAGTGGFVLILGFGNSSSDSDSVSESATGRGTCGSVLLSRFCEDFTGLDLTGSFWRSYKKIFSQWNDTGKKSTCLSMSMIALLSVRMLE